MRKDILQPERERESYAPSIQERILSVAERLEAAVSAKESLKVQLGHLEDRITELEMFWRENFEKEMFRVEDDIDQLKEALIGDELTSSEQGSIKNEIERQQEKAEELNKKIKEIKTESSFLIEKFKEIQSAQELSSQEIDEILDHIDTLKNLSPLAQEVNE